MRKLIKILIIVNAMLSIACSLCAQVDQKFAANVNYLDSLVSIYSRQNYPIFVKHGVDGKAAFYYCDSNSTAAVDGYNVLAVTNKTKGRYFLLPFTDGSGNVNADSININYFVDSVVAVPPSAPNTNDKVLIVNSGGAGMFIGHETNVATWNGSTWIYDTAKLGQFAAVAKTNLVEKFDGSIWNVYGLVTHPYGDGYGINQSIGTKDNFDVYFIAKGQKVLTLTKARKVRWSQVYVDSISTGIRAAYVLGVDGNMHTAAYGSGGGSTSPVGNYNNFQLNRNGAFNTPGSDSATWISGSGFSVKGGYYFGSNFAFGTSGGNLYYQPSGTGSHVWNNAAGTQQNMILSNAGALNVVGTGTFGGLLQGSNILTSAATAPYFGTPGALFTCSASNTLMLGNAQSDATGTLLLNRANLYNLNILPSATLIAPTSGFNLTDSTGAGATFLFPSGIRKSLFFGNVTSNARWSFQNKSYTVGDSADIANGLATKQNTLTLTTTGTSGAATLSGSTLNIPQYSGGGGSGIDSVYRKQAGINDSIYTRKSGVNSYSFRDSFPGIQSLPSGLIIIDTTIGTTKNRVGTIYDSSLWANTNYFTKTGTVTVSGNKFQFGAGNNVLAFPNGSMLDQESVQIDFKYKTTIASTDSGIVVAWNSVNPNSQSNTSLIAYGNIKSGADFGKAKVLQYINGALSKVYLASHAISSINVNDSLSFTITMRDSYQQILFKNNATGDTSSLTIPVNNFPGQASGWSHNTAILSVGTNAQANNFINSTSVEIDRIKWSSPQPKGAAAMVVGNSIAYGGSVALASQRFGEQAYLVIEAGAGDVSTSYLSRINEIVNVVQPKNIFIEYTGNDKGFSVVQSTTFSNYLKFRDSMIAHGINVIMLYPFPRGNDFSSDISFINTNFPNHIDTYTPLLGTGFNLNTTYNQGIGDGVHLNLAGHTVVANTIKASSYYQALANGVYAAYYNNPTLSASTTPYALVNIENVNAAIAAAFPTSPVGGIAVVNGDGTFKTNNNLRQDTAKGWFGINSPSGNPVGLIDFHGKFTGTVATTLGSAVVTGTGTYFDQSLFKNDSMMINGAFAGFVSTKTSNTSVTLDRTQGATASGLSYSTPFGNAGIHWDENLNWYKGGYLYSTSSANSYNLSMGFSSLANSATGGNASFGNFSMQSSTSGYYNAAFGTNALKTSTTGYGNAVLGWGANQFGSPVNSVVNGYKAGYTNAGSENVFIGANAGGGNTSGTYNTFLGSSAGLGNTTANENTGIGQNVFGAVSSGAQNTAMGRNAGTLTNSGANVTSIDRSVLVGDDARVLNATGSTNEIVIGYAGRGNGSNTTTISNTSTIMNYLGGGGLDIPTLSTTPTPASGHAVMWFDGTNVKITKNVSGTTSTAVIY